MDNHFVDHMTASMGRKCKELLNYGWSFDAIAEELRVTTVDLQDALNFESLPQAIHRLIARGDLEFATALQTFRDCAYDPERTATQLQALAAARTTVSFEIADCLSYLREQRAQGRLFDAVITDPPYEINLHKQSWDRTGIAFASELWDSLLAILKPGGFIAACCYPRLYHRLATAAETAGFRLFPFLTWVTNSACPKPANLAEMFDRDHCDKSERTLIGYSNGSGFTHANIRQGAQSRSRTFFPRYRRHVSPEGQQWHGYYYGLTCLAPNIEPILLAQKPPEPGRIVDNIRKWGVGALNIHALRSKYGNWPGLTLTHPRDMRQNGHSGVKPVSLMEDLCLLLCPGGGTILDPFAGTGSTGVAAKRTNHRCVLVEQNPKLAAVIASRLAE
jgi:site-specific DNA-methyltransferase (adenine-specific)